MAFPFSLINSQEQGDLGDISPGFNHLRPGWVLAESMFMVIRNEDKYQRRVKARLVISMLLATSDSTNEIIRMFLKQEKKKRRESK